MVQAFHEPPFELCRKKFNVIIMRIQPMDFLKAFKLLAFSQRWFMAYNSID
jgi:hypothetical protein